MSPLRMRPLVVLHLARIDDAVIWVQIRVARATPHVSISLVNAAQRMAFLR
jgi:hypothetical protein